jgi:hypothetical protein
MESEYSSAEDATGEPARVSPRFLWLLGLVLAVLTAAGAYVVAEHIMTSKAIEQLGRSVAHGSIPAKKVAVAAVPAAARAARPAAAVPPPDSGWIGGDADLASETSGGARGSGSEAPDGALRTSGGADPVLTRAGAPADVAGSSAGGAEGGAGKRPRERVPGYEAELEKHYSSTFARCPRPGVSGAVECRRAVCAGGARKSAACRFYAQD